MNQLFDTNGIVAANAASLIGLHIAGIVMAIIQKNQQKNLQQFY